MGERIRVLQLVNGEVYAGAERVQEMLLKMVDRERFQVVCVALMDGTFVRRARAQGLPVEVIPMRGRWDLGVVRRLARYIRARRVHLVHTHTVRTNAVGRLAAARAGVPVITHVHGSPLAEWEDGLKVRINWALERLTRNLSDRFLCVSQGLREELLADGVPAERVRVVPNGLEPEWFACGRGRGDGSAGKAELLAELGLPEEAVEAAWVVLPAWLRPLKGVEVFLEALAQLNAHTPRVRVWGLLVGGFLSTGYGRRVQAEARRLGLAGQIRWLDFRPPEELCRLLQAADAVVLPSRKPEGLPISLLEAMALGKPVIASGIGGVSELVRDGETGRLVPPNDPAALAAAIAEVVANPERAHRWAEAGRCWVEKHHRAEEMVRRVEAIYRELLEERS